MILVTGAGGMLGRDIMRAGALGGLELHAVTKRELDVTNAAAVADLVAAVEPSAIINCAAYTDVDGCETAEEDAYAVNALGAGILAAAAARTGAHLVQVSTDYVFDGAATSPYVESDPVGPRSAYGRTKLAGEQAVLDASPDHAVVRTSWLHGTGGPNFVATMLRLAEDRDEISVVTDQVGCPTWTGHLAPVLLEIAERRIGGVQHASGAGACSWNEFALEIFDAADVTCRVLPTTSAQFTRPAPRPAFSVLGSERADHIDLPPWADGLKAHLTERETAGERT